MKLKFSGQYGMNPRDLIRRCGYGEVAKYLSTLAPKHLSTLALKQTGKLPSLREHMQGSGGEVSYVRSLGRTPFPRFHVYIDSGSDGFQINLHLDQKQPTYGEGTAHSGEYDGEVVSAEADRIRNQINQLSLNANR